MIVRSAKRRPAFPLPQGKDDRLTRDSLLRHPGTLSGPMFDLSKSIPLA